MEVQWTDKQVNKHKLVLKQTFWAALLISAGQFLFINYVFCCFSETRRCSQIDLYPQVCLQACSVFMLDEMMSYIGHQGWGFGCWRNKKILQRTNNRPKNDVKHYWSHIYTDRYMKNIIFFIFSMVENVYGSLLCIYFKVIWNLSDRTKTCRLSWLLSSRDAWQCRNHLSILINEWVI